MPLASYVIERSFPVPPARLFHAFTAPEDLATWAWGPYGKDVAAEVEAKVGGTFSVTTDGASFGKKGERAEMRGVYLEFAPPRRLVHTLHWDAPVGYNGPGKDPLDEAVVVEFAPEGAGTRLRYAHLGIPDEGASAKEHERSMRACFDLLARHLDAHREGASRKGP